jgi:DNA recombination protein RmuC
MEIAIGIAIAVTAVCFAVFIVIFTRQKSPATESSEALKLFSQRLEDIGSLRTKVEAISSVQDALRNSLFSLETALKGVETRVVESTGSVKDSVLRDFGEARRTLEGIKNDLDARKQLEREIQESSRRIETIIAGGRSRGRAGENILAEAFKQFPPQIIEPNFRVKGYTVEYALVLADGKRVPIDSKWSAAELMESLDSENDAAQRERIVHQIEQVVLSKVKEVAKYIDPSVTTSWGIAAVPDAAFAICRNTHLDAFSHKVILMPFSLAVVYLLSLYQLHLEYCRSVDSAKLEGFLDQIEQGLEKLDKELENKVWRGATMTMNAFEECKRQIGVMRGAAAYLRSLPAGEEVSQLEMLKDTYTDSALPCSDPTTQIDRNRAIDFSQEE